jgi:hypothetical protein
VNVKFLGLDLSMRSCISSSIVAAWLFMQILKSQRKRKELLEKGDILFRYAFPLMVFVLLASLPSVKAVFILTSMTFSFIVHLFRPFFTRQMQVVKNAAAKVGIG